MKLWIARDKRGFLRVWDGKPEWDDKIGLWCCEAGTVDFMSFPFKSDEFPEVTWENSPQQVELKLIEDDHSEK